jgi:hypothetical protein
LGFSVSEIMALEDLEKKLYRRTEAEDKGEVTKKKAEPSSPSPGQTGKPTTPSAWGKVVSQTPISRPSFSLSARAKGAIYFLLGFLVIVGAGFFLLQRLFAPQEIRLEVIGAREVRSGERVEFEVFLENKARSPMRDTTLTIRAGSGVIFTEAPEQSVVSRGTQGELAAGALRKEIVSLQFYGKPGDTREIEASFRYQLGDGSTRFEETKRMTVIIAAPTISFDLNVPTRVISQDPFTFSISWKNVSSQTISEGFTRLELPPEFEIIDAKPAPEENTTRWQSLDLAADETESIALTGKLVVPEGEVRRMRATFEIPLRGELILVSENETEISLASNPLALAISINNFQDYTASPGETLEYKVGFKNNFELALRDVVITALLESALFDLATVESVGSFSSRNKTITWHGGNTPQLLALTTQESGAVSFRVRLKETFTLSEKNNRLKISVQASSPTKPASLGGQAIVTAKSEKEIKVHGKLELVALVLRQDPKAPFANTGPIPPRVNQTTTYSAHIKFNALGNDFRDIFARTVLPSGVTFTGKTSGNIAGTDFVFNPRTNEIIWQIPRIEAFATKGIIFQISATPSLTQVGQLMELFQAVEASGVDDWTGNEVRLQTRAILSDLPDDPTVDSITGQVQP